MLKTKISYLSLSSKTNIIILSFSLSGVTFGLGNIDSFPWHVITIIFLSQNIYKKLDIFIFMMVMGCICITALVDISYYSNNLFIRQILNYSSIIIGGAYLLRNELDPKIILKSLIMVSVFNIIIGFSQNFSEAFTVFSNARMDESGRRGTMGLFSEPTSYGLFSTFCLFFGILSVRVSKGRDEIAIARKLIWLSSLSVILINQSSTAILIILIYLAVYALTKFKGMVLFLVLIIIGILLKDYYIDTRFGQIIRILTERDLLYLLSIDGSVNERLSSVIGPYYGFIENIFLPNSAFTYSETYMSLREYSNNFFWWGGSNKIMNLAGSLIYELSLLGLVVLLRYIYRPSNFLKNVDILLAAFILLNNSVPLLHGYPLFLLVFLKWTPLIKALPKPSKTSYV